MADDFGNQNVQPPANGAAVLVPVPSTASADDYHLAKNAGSPVTNPVTVTLANTGVEVKKDVSLIKKITSIGKKSAKVSASAGTDVPPTWTEMTTPAEGLADASSDIVKLVKNVVSGAAGGF